MLSSMQYKPISQSISDPQPQQDAPVVLQPRTADVASVSAARTPPLPDDDFVQILSGLPLPAAFQSRQGFVQCALRAPDQGGRVDGKVPCMPAEGMPEVRTYINLMAGGASFYADIDTLLLKLIGKSSALERGVVGPTGGSSVISMNVLGPIFGIYGLMAGSKIVTNSANAASYLTDLIASVQIKQAALEATRADIAKNSPELTVALIDLDNRIAAVKAYLTGIELSRNEQAFNLTMPGAVQLSASALILTYGLDLLGGGLLPAASTAALGIAVPVFLEAYATGSLIKNSIDLTGACRVRKLEFECDDSPELAAYKAAYNDGVTGARRYYGLNAASWSMYVAGAAGLIAIGAGATATNGGLMIGLVVGGAFLPIIWDIKWGQQCAPHNALTPHVDRNFLDSMERRAQVWEMLCGQRNDLDIALKEILGNLPNHHDDPTAMSLKFWKNIPKEDRYKYFWQLIPGDAGARRLGKWGVKDFNVVDPAIHEYMVSYTRREVDYVRLKLMQSGVALSRRAAELQGVGEGGLEKFLSDDFLVFCNDLARVQALQGLLNELTAFDPRGARCTLESVEQWNRLRLGFLSVQGLLGAFAHTKYVAEHPSWFCYDVAPATFFHREKFSNVRLSEEGFDALARNFDEPRERDFVATVINPKTNKYEIDAVLNLEKTAHRNKEQHALTMAREAELKGQSTVEMDAVMQALAQKASALPAAPAPIG